MFRFHTSWLFYTPRGQFLNTTWLNFSIFGKNDTKRSKPHQCGPEHVWYPLPCTSQRSMGGAHLWPHAWGRIFPSLACRFEAWQDMAGGPWVNGPRCWREKHFRFLFIIGTIFRHVAKIWFLIGIVFRAFPQPRVQSREHKWNKVGSSNLQIEQDWLPWL